MQGAGRAVGGGESSRCFFIFQFHILVCRVLVCQGVGEPGSSTFLLRGVVECIGRSVCRYRPSVSDGQARLLCLPSQIAMCIAGMG